MLIGLAVVLLLIALLAIPVTLSFEVAWRHAFEGNIRIGWLFGLVRLPIPLKPRKAAPPKSTEKPTATPHTPKEKSKGFALFRQTAFRRRLLRLLREVWRAIGKRDVRFHLRIGLGDPAETGQLWALLGPVSGILANMRSATVELEPEFLDSSFELDGSGQVRLIPLQMIYLVTGFLLSPQFQRALRQARKGC